MKGFVPTPVPVVDMMVEKLFHERTPTPGSILLDPGCGTGAFIEGVLRWSARTGSRAPHIVGVDSDPSLLAKARERVGTSDRVVLLEGDFLEGQAGAFDYIIGNPPYVSITGLSDVERARYRQRFSTASGRFDLYTLFFEQAIKLLKPDGRLVFITPEKFTYVQSTSRLRRYLAEVGVSELSLMPEDTFGGLVTYPAVTVLDASRASTETRLTLRQGGVRLVRLPTDGGSWLPLFADPVHSDATHVLLDAFCRISCGVATGADQVFVHRDAELPPSLRQFAYPTISGRELDWPSPLAPTKSMLVPYSRSGALIPESDLGALGEYLRQDDRSHRLRARTCTSRKPWYAFHENPPLTDILRPKILCKDIATHPRFFEDRTGSIVPRHSVYYLVPHEPERLSALCTYLNSEPVAEFLQVHCQRASNGFIRLQSHILKRVPVPVDLIPQNELECV